MHAFKLDGPLWWERTARDYVEAVAAGGLVATESKVLGRCGASDLVSRVWQQAAGSHADVAAEVDGETHFERPWRDSSQLEQLDRDRETDKEAWQHGQRQVRLHHRDSALWAAAQQPWA